MNQIPGQPWPPVLFPAEQFLFSAVPQLWSFSTEDWSCCSPVCSGPLPAWESTAAAGVHIHQLLPFLLWALSCSSLLSISSFCSWPVSWSSYRHAANFSCGSNSGFLWWGKNKTRKSELMLESRVFPSWIHLMHTENISDVGAALIYWKGSSFPASPEWGVN